MLVTVHVLGMSVNEWLQMISLDFFSLAHRDEGEGS